MKKMMIMAAAAVITAGVACAGTPSREDIIKKYSNVSPKEWSETLPGIVQTLDTKDDVVALTLDLCRYKLDHELISFLIDEKIPVTFFVSSRWVKEHHDDLAMLASVPTFDIAAHGMRHVPASLSGRSAWGIAGTKNAADLYDEVVLNADELEHLTGVRPRFFRSGTAFYDEEAIKLIREIGFTPVGFSILGDAGATYSEEQVVNAVTKARSGDIIIAHANHPEAATGRGLMRALPMLRERGLRFVKLSEYIGNK